MRHVLILSTVVLAASLSFASAQVRSQSIVVSPLPAAAPTAHLSAALAELVRRGGSITLTGAQGHTVATVNPDGSVKLSARMILGNATAVTVRRENTLVSYPLAVPVDNSGQLLVTRRNADGRTQVIPLIAALNSTQGNRKDGQDGKKGDGRKDGQDGESGGSGHQGGDDQQPGRGNGHH